jgi:hypothetical protein
VGIRNPAIGLDTSLPDTTLCGLDLELHIVPRDDSDLHPGGPPSRLSGQERPDRHSHLGRQLENYAQSATPDVELDRARLCPILNRHKVIYTLIGGLAVFYHGAPLPTEDAAAPPNGPATTSIASQPPFRELNARDPAEVDPKASPLRATRHWPQRRPPGTQGYPDLPRGVTSAESTMPQYKSPHETSSVQTGGQSP